MKKSGVYVFAISREPSVPVLCSFKESMIKISKGCSIYSFPKNQLEIVPRSLWIGSNKILAHFFFFCFFKTIVNGMLFHCINFIKKSTEKKVLRVVQSSIEKVLQSAAVF